MKVIITHFSKWKFKYHLFLSRIFITDNAGWRRKILKNEMEPSLTVRQPLLRSALSV